MKISFRISLYNLFLAVSLISFSVIFFIQKDLISVKMFALMLSIFLIIAFFKEKTNFKLVFLVVGFNYLMLTLVLYGTDSRPSYLSSSEFVQYYELSLFLELIFWLLLAFFLNLIILRHNDDIDRIKVGAIADEKLIFLAGIFALIIEILINFNKYFVPYVDSSDIGTPLFEAGSLLIALAIFSKSRFVPRNSILLMMEILALALIVFITAGSGKRLALSFIVIAYLVHIKSDWRKLFLYCLFFATGYLHGLFRDILLIDQFSFSMVSDSLKYTNQGGSLHAAATYLRLIDEGTFGAEERAQSFFYTFVGALVIPVSYLPDIAQLNKYAMNFYEIQGNGGLAGVYSFFYLGLPGPLLAAFFIASFSKVRNKICVTITSILVITVIRWTMYNVIPLVRVLSYVVILLFVLLLIAQILKGYKVKKSF